MYLQNFNIFPCWIAEYDISQLNITKQPSAAMINKNSN